MTVIGLIWYSDHSVDRYEAKQLQIYGLCTCEVPFGAKTLDCDDVKTSVDRHFTIERVIIDLILQFEGLTVCLVNSFTDFSCTMVGCRGNSRYNTSSVQLA